MARFGQLFVFLSPIGVLTYIAIYWMGLSGREQYFISGVEQPYFILNYINLWLLNYL